MNLRALCWMATGLFLGLGGMLLWDRFSPPRVEWSSDLEGAQERAKDAGRPVLALFASSSGLGEGVLTERSVLDALNFRVIPLRLDPGQEEDLAGSLEVAGLPAWRLLDEQGHEISRRDGVLDADALVAWLKESAVAIPSEAKAMEGFTRP